MASSYEKRIQAYQAAHPGASRAEARGHGRTPEHGGLLPLQKHTSTPGHEIYQSYSDRAAEQAINRAANHDSRVRIGVYDKAGNFHQAGGARGYSASYVAEQIAKTGSLRGVVVGSMGAVGEDNYDMPDDEEDIDAWDIDELLV